MRRVEQILNKLNLSEFPEKEKCMQQCITDRKLVCGSIIFIPDTARKKSKFTDLYGRKKICSNLKRQMRITKLRSLGFQTNKGDTKKFKQRKRKRIESYLTKYQNCNQNVNKITTKSTNKDSLLTLLYKQRGGKKKTTIF